MPVVGLPTNRTSIDLPADVSREILQKAQEGSAVMKLARQVVLPGRGAAINVITSDVEAGWVGETAKKPTSNPGLATKVLRGYKLAVIVPFSKEFERDAAGLYDALIERLPGALAAKFDATVFGNGTAPGSDFDTLASATAQAIGGQLTYGGLVSADADISAHGGLMNGIVLAPQGRATLLTAVDGDRRPLFINNAAEGAIPMVLGAQTVSSKGAYKAGTGSTPVNQIGIAGDWTQAVWGTVEGVTIDRADQATLTDGEGNVISLFERNMIAIRAEIEVGFRADVTCFNRLTDATA